MRPDQPQFDPRISEYGKGRKAIIRTLSDLDKPHYRDFLNEVNANDLRLRFFGIIKAIDSKFISWLLDKDRDHTTILAAVDQETHDILGIVRLHSDVAERKGEYAILVRSKLKGYGLGWALMQAIIACANSIGLKQIQGQVLSENLVMLKMCKELGFSVKPSDLDRTIYDVTLDLPQSQSNT